MFIKSNKQCIGCFCFEEPNALCKCDCHNDFINSRLECGDVMNGTRLEFPYVNSWCSKHDKHRYTLLEV